jgi:O-antigen/teichoic acid export membrane protein
VSSMLGQAVDVLIEIGPIVILSRLLSPSDFGVMAMAVSVAGLLAAIKEAGLSAATVQAPKITHEQVTALFWINVALGLGVAVLSSGAGALAAWWMHQPLLVWLVPSLGLTGAIDCFGIQHDALLQRKLEFRKSVTRQLIARVMGVTAGIIAAFQGAGIWSLVLMQAVSALASTLTLWMACSWRPGPPRNLRVAYPMLRFGVKILLDRTIAQATRGLDSIVIGYYHGSVATGLYARAQGLIGKPLTRVLAPIMNVARPAFSRAAQDPARFRRAVSEALGIVSLGSAMLVALLVPASHGIVRILLGPAWAGAVPIFSALACFALVEPCASIVGSMVVASGRPGALLKWRLVSIVMVIAGLVLAAPYGVVVIAYTYAGMGLLVRTPLFLWYAGRLIGVPFRVLLSDILPATVVSAGTILLVSLLRRSFEDPASIASTIVLILASAVVYLGGCLLFERPRKAMLNLWSQVAAMVVRRAPAPVLE